ncbi:hypothetical protein VTH06DRAFT_3415 [Thermothelomyces fergusii]
MLSPDSSLPSPGPGLDLRPSTLSTPTSDFQSQGAVPDDDDDDDDGFASPQQQQQQQFESRTPTPSSTLHPDQQQQQQQQQHGLSVPRPSLSPLSEYHSGFAGEDHGSALNLGNHRRQHSFPNILPQAFTNRTPSPGRNAHVRSPSEQMPYTGDGRFNGRAAAGGGRGGGGGGGGLVSWLSGSTAGTSRGLSTTPTTTPTSNGRNAGSSSNPADATTAKSAASTTAASRFMSAFSSRFTSAAPTGSSSLRNPPTGEQQEDELCTLDIEAALFPSSPSSPSSSAMRDPFSPSAFKNLHMNAVGLLTRMQAAYRSQAAALRDLRAERAAEREELEEALTRATHLKMQLEGMARKAAEREAAAQALAGELERERKARAKAEAELAAAMSSKTSEGEGAPSMVSEDLGVEEDRRRRRRRPRRRRSSGDEGGVAEEEGSSTTDDEIDSAESESVFSRCRSPPLTLQSPLQTQAPPMGPLDGTSASRGAAGGSGTPSAKNAGGSGSVTSTPKQRTGQPMGAFQKILRGFSGDTAGCSNCKGRDASVAWDTVSLLRDENRHLKDRIGELEHAVEGALDLVNGIGLKVPPLA